MKKSEISQYFQVVENAPRAEDKKKDEKKAGDSVYMRSLKRKFNFSIDGVSVETTSSNGQRHDEVISYILSFSIVF